MRWEKIEIELNYIGLRLPDFQEKTVFFAYNNDRQLRGIQIIDLPNSFRRVHKIKKHAAN